MGARCKLIRNLGQVMESLEHAMRRGARVLVGYLGGAASCDAHHVANPRPDGRGISLCIKRSLEDAGVALEEVTITKMLISIVTTLATRSQNTNANATSSPAGDLAELKALKQVFKDTSQIKMNATKSHLHSDDLPVGTSVWEHRRLMQPLCFKMQSMIGHCLGAAGGLEAIATIKAITTGWVHPTINQFVSAHPDYTSKHLNL